MRKIILNLAVSLDGLIEGEHGEYDWCLTDQDYGMTEFCQHIDTVLLGRKSYEVLRDMEEHPYPGMTKYVVSQTLKADRDDVVILNEDWETEVRKIKQLDGKDIFLFGGAALANRLLDLGLIDELHLSVHPLLLGKGKPLFQTLDKRICLSLLSVKEYASGLVQLLYRVN